jgi:antirestriction protein ArdC
MIARRDSFARVESALREAIPRSRGEAAMPFDPDKAGFEAEDRDFESTGNAKLDRIVARSGARVRFGAEAGTVVSGSSGFTPGDLIPNDPDVTWIEMPNVDAFHAQYGYRATLAHELIHWTKVAGMVPRPMVGWTMFDRMFGHIPEGYPDEEIVAEIGAALLLDAVGEDPKPAERVSYIAGWLGKVEGNKDEALARATTVAEQAVEALLSAAAE